MINGANAPALPLFTNDTFNKIKSSNKQADNKTKLPNSTAQKPQLTKPTGMTTADWKEEKTKLLAISKQKAKTEEFQSTNATALAASKKKNNAIKCMPSNSSFQGTDSKKTLHESDIE